MSEISTVTRNLRCGGHLSSRGVEPIYVDSGTRGLLHIISDLVDALVDAEVITAPNVVGGYAQLLNILEARYGRHPIIREQLEVWAEQGR